jgi:hypothetical protein
VRNRRSSTASNTSNTSNTSSSIPTSAGSLDDLLKLKGAARKGNCDRRRVGRVRIRV